MRDLYAFVGRDLLGIFHETRDGAVFEYVDSARSTPLSLSLPRGRTSSPQAGINYLDNLLPDRRDVRERWARERGLASSDTFTLASSYGEDVAGAVTLTPDPDRPRKAAGPLIEATEDDIASRIASIRRDDTSWIDPRVKPRMSLAGAQGKFSLTRVGDRWFWPTYDNPSTHIFKPPSPQHRDIETFEVLGLELARSVGVEAATSRRMTWLGQPCFVVERFDRDQSGQRLPAEDLNQALGRPVDAKYAATAPEVARLLAAHGSERRFVRQLAFNIAFGNGDAHAKNYSVLIAGGRAVLAPIYDTVPTILYPHYNSDFSMPIGNARRPGDLNEKNWRRFADDAGLDGDMVCEEAFAITAKVADRYEALFAKAGIDPQRLKIIQKHVRVLRRGLPAPTATALSSTGLVASSGNPYSSVRSTSSRRASSGGECGRPTASGGTCKRRGHCPYHR